MIVGVFRKQPYDKIDFTVDMSEWLDEYGGDTISSVSATVDDSDLTLVETTHDAGIIRQWVDDGLSGQNYLVTIHMITDGGRELEFEVRVKVRET